MGFCTSIQICKSFFPYLRIALLCFCQCARSIRNCLITLNQHLINTAPSPKERASTDNITGCFDLNIEGSESGSHAFQFIVAPFLFNFPISRELNHFRYGTLKHLRRGLDFEGHFSESITSKRRIKCAEFRTLNI